MNHGCRHGFPFMLSKAKVQGNRLLDYAFHWKRANAVDDKRIGCSDRRYGQNATIARLMSGVVDLGAGRRRSAPIGEHRRCQDNTRAPAGETRRTSLHPVPAGPVYRVLDRYDLARCKARRHRHREGRSSWMPHSSKAKTAPPEEQLDQVDACDLGSGRGSGEQHRRNAGIDDRKADIMSARPLQRFAGR